MVNNNFEPDEDVCYHCGLPLQQGSVAYALVAGERRPMCCAGCQAVAETIEKFGLSSYYVTRDTFSDKARETTPAFLEELAAYDQPEVQRELVSHEGGPGRCESTLLIEGIRCGACVWLIEHRLRYMAGVESFALNFATHRARVEWDGSRLTLSAILRAIADIGYTASPYDPARSEQAFRKQRNDYLKRLFVAGFGMMQVMMYALPVYVAGAGDMSSDIEQLMRVAGMLLTIPVVCYSAWPILSSAWRDVRAARAGMDVPVALGILVAFAASTAATLNASGVVYFDSISMFVFLLLAARFLEFSARRHAAANIERLTQSAPAIARRLVDYPTSLATETVAAVGLQPGDHVLVAPGENFPADGIVVSGSSAADESLLTGESRPAHKLKDASLTGGSINLDAPIVMRVTGAGHTTRLAAIVRLLDQALADKPRIVKTADRVAGWFVAALLLVSLVSGVAWLMIDPSRAPWIVVAVLVVTCPCALSLATPAALTAATARLAALGVLVTRGHAIETLARADTFVFDKTGTLTRGRMALRHVEVLSSHSSRQCLALAAALEQGMEHPMARSIRFACQNPQLPLAQAVNLDKGRGVEGQIDGEALRLGSLDYVAEVAGVPRHVGHTAINDANSVVFLGSENSWLARFEFDDELRLGAAQLTQVLRDADRRVIVLSGDAEEPVRSIARTLGIDTWRSRMSPEGKHAFVAGLQVPGSVIATVGDGLNDAPVLAQSHVSIAMGEGAALAQAHADIVLLNNDIASLGEAIRIAQRCMRIVRQNVAWAVAYNLVALPLAIGGFLTPWIAGIGMAASSTLVVLNALRVAPMRSKRPARRAASGAVVLGKAAV